jgi:hypothetical protein
MTYYLYNLKSKIIECVKNNMVFDQLYFQESRIPTENDVAEQLKSGTNNQKINEFFETNSYTRAIQKIKNSISKIEEKVPLYDIMTQNIYLIGKYNVYNRVTLQSYRFPDEDLMKELVKKLEDLYNTSGKSTFDNTSGKSTFGNTSEISTSSVTNSNKSPDPMVTRLMRKLELMIEFMQSFNIPILQDTYVKVFYKYSTSVGHETTTCIRPSYSSHMYHIRPYFSRNEIINMAYNMKAISKKKNNLDYSSSEIHSMCESVQLNEFSNKMLTTHKRHIILNDQIGLVQYYTLQGSFFINQYLRNFTEYTSRNQYLEQIIKPMWNLVRTSPEFDKRYVVYRFIKNDDYLQNLTVGSEYVEEGFMSTTRDPFYRSDLYKFGFILLRITIPANIQGVALCLETISHFPEEQEVVFPPKSIFKLVSRDENCTYYHTDESFQSKIKTRYEFEWVGNGEIEFNRKSGKNKVNNIDFLSLDKTDTLTLSECIKFFIEQYVDPMYQFNVTLGSLQLTVKVEWYDSTGAYKNFYALATNDGFSMCTFYKGYILFFIEIGEEQGVRQMHINYHLKYSALDVNKIVGDEDLIKFYALIANYFDISSIVIYTSYLNCDENSTTVGTTVISVRQRGFESVKDSKLVLKSSVELPVVQSTESLTALGGSYCLDFYQYLKNQVKKYADINVLNMELQPKFSYYDLDTMHSLKPTTILLKSDRDEVYQIYDKYYKPLCLGDELKVGLKTHAVDSIAGFYIWLKENRCYLMDLFVVKLDRIFADNNPFRNAMYVFDASTYLYNRNLITSYPTYFNIDINPKKNMLMNKVYYR